MRESILAFASRRKFVTVILSELVLQLIFMLFCKIEGFFALYSTS